MRSNLNSDGDDIIQAHPPKEGETWDEVIDRFLTILEGVKAVKVLPPGGLLGEYLYHVLAIFDDQAVVVKFFGTHKRRWFYRVLNIWDLYFAWESGRLELRKK